MPDRWPRIERIFAAVVAPPVAEQASMLAELCAGDEALLAHDGAAAAFLEAPAFAGADIAGDLADERPLVGRRFGP